jgi:hypothetical protein
MVQGSFIDMHLKVIIILCFIILTSQVLSRIEPMGLP